MVDEWKPKLRYVPRDILMFVKALPQALWFGLTWASRGVNASLLTFVKCEALTPSGADPIGRPHPALQM
jgi:hypothetical protein